jgi:hypothetical protein
MQIHQVEAEVDVRPNQAADQPREPSLIMGSDGIDRATLERLRPMVLQILREELERLNRQQGY